MPKRRQQNEGIHKVSDTDKTQLMGTRLRPYIPHFLLGSGFAVLIALTVYSWAGHGEHFPTIAPGSYAGLIQIPGKEEVPFFVERKHDSDDVLFIGLSAGWEAQVTSATVRAASNSEWDLPLTIRGDQATFQLVGSTISASHYSGRISELGAQNEGTWVLSRAQESDNIEVYNPAQLQLRTLLTHEYLGLSGQVLSLEEKLTQQKKELEQFTQLSTEAGLAEAKSAEQLKILESEIASIEQKLSKQRKNIEKLKEQITLTQKVSAEGKLLLLAKESLDREARWAASIIKQAPDVKEEGLAEKIQMAKKLLDLKRQIAATRNEIFRQRFGTTAPEAEAP